MSLFQNIFDIDINSVYPAMPSLQRILSAKNNINTSQKPITVKKEFICPICGYTEEIECASSIFSFKEYYYKCKCGNYLLEHMHTVPVYEKELIEIKYFYTKVDKKEVFNNILDTNIVDIDEPYITFRKNYELIEL